MYFEVFEAKFSISHHDWRTIGIVSAKSRQEAAEKLGLVRNEEKTTAAKCLEDPFFYKKGELEEYKKGKRCHKDIVGYILNKIKEFTEPLK